MIEGTRGEKRPTGVFDLVDDDDPATGEHHLDFNEVVDAEPVDAALEPKSVRDHDGRAHEVRRVG